MFCVYFADTILLMNPITYWRATVDDVAAISEMRIRFFIDFDGPRPQEEQDALRLHLESYFKRTIANNTYICWLAKDGNEVVGIGGMTVREHPGNFKNPSGGMGYVMNMYTLPSHRRMGISTHILNKLQESGKEIGIRLFELHATEEGEPVYQKNGFKKHNEPTYRKFEP